MKILNINLILSISPWIEVLIKSIYWRSNFVYKLLSPFAKKKHIIHIKNTESTEKISFQKVKEFLSEMGAISGRIMIVHSSMSALQHTGLKASDICAELIDFLGSNGTLAMPAIPILRGEARESDRMNDSVSTDKLLYDVNKSPPSTGALAKALMGTHGAVRSRHPLNTMVAVGRFATDMMIGNIDGDRPMACGPNSSWKFCADHNAVIVCFGVDTSHSLTMIHVAEDSWAEKWPIFDWYRERTFQVIDTNFKKDITVLERRAKWSINYAERTLQKDLINNGILKIGNVNGLKIEICESAKLIDFLNSKKNNAYPYYFPFWTKTKK